MRRAVPTSKRGSKGITAAPSSRLDFAHLVLPHTPWELTPTGRSYDPGADVGESPYYYQWAGDAAARFNRDRHLTQLQYTDHLIQELLARLDALGTYDDSLVVVTADHGVAFSGDVPVRAPTPANLTQIVWSPLFIKAPHQRAGRIDDRNAENIDVLPTIADLAGTHLPWSVDGRSLAGSPRRSPVKHVVPPVAQNQVPLDASGRIRIQGRSGFRDGAPIPARDHRLRRVRVLPGWTRRRHRGQTGRRAYRPARRRTRARRSIPAASRSTRAAGRSRSSCGPRSTARRRTPWSRSLVNQIVVGTYRPTGDHKARWVVPEAVLHTGHNDVALATVTGDAGNETLHRLATG